MTRPTWDPEYAALVALRNAGVKAAGKSALLAAYRARQGLAALCDCTAETTELSAHLDWCGFRRSAERPPPVYDVEAQARMAAVHAELRMPVGKVCSREGEHATCEGVPRSTCPGYAELVRKVHEVAGFVAVDGDPDAPPWE